MTPGYRWEDSPALWNRTGFDPRSDEMVAQVMDRGTLSDWRELYRLAEADPALRRRMRGIIARVPLPYPHFWLAALANLGELVDYDMKMPEEPGI